MDLVCKKCNAPRNKGRRTCNRCRAEEMRNKYSPENRKRFMVTITCVACKQEARVYSKSSVLCSICFHEALSYTSSKEETSNNYVYVGYDPITKKTFFEHRMQAEKLLKRVLTYNEVIHHLDGNPKNNQVINLIVLSRGNHVRLHMFLGVQRVIFEKSENENFENCWDTLRASITTTWLETTGVKVIKIWEIGQSASKPLTSIEGGEGSETMYGTSVTGDAVEDDIVQTTTLKRGLGN